MKGVLGGIKGAFGVDRYFWPFSGEPPPGRGGSAIFGGNSWIKGVFGGIKGAFGVDRCFWDSWGEPPGRGGVQVGK